LQSIVKYNQMPKILKTIWDEFVYGGHILSLGAVSIVWSCAIILNLYIDWIFLLIVYLGIHSMYLFNRYQEIESDLNSNPERATHLKNLRGLVVTQIIAFISISIILLIKYGTSPALYLGIIMYFLGLLYTFKFKSFTKHIIGFKNLFIPLLYTLLLALFFYYYGYIFSTGFYLLIIFIYIRLYIATAFYDLKDVEEDKKNSLLTVAVVLPRKHFFRLILIFNVVSIIPLLIGSYFGLIPYFALILLLVVPYFWVYVLLSKKSKNLPLYSYVFCDGEYILWLPLILISKTICNY